MENVNILDCTLRDGGYYTDWNFSSDLIHRYLDAMERAGVFNIELGFRFLSDSGYKGPLAYTTDKYLDSLCIPKKINIGVMINASDLAEGESVSAVIDRLVPRRSDQSKVKFIRIASHYHELDNAIAACRLLVEKGYEVGINLMQIASRTEAEIVSFAERSKDLQLFAVYIADSTGSLTPEKTESIITLLGRWVLVPIGIHTHDNLGLALSNSLAAMSVGATWLDATITGMGRGPGNTRTEDLAISLGFADHKLEPVITVAEEVFKPLQMQHNWGTNPYYRLAGLHEIHPSYIQKILSEDRYSVGELLTIINYLSEHGGRSYNADNITSAFDFTGVSELGEWLPIDELSDRDVLIVANSATSQKLKNEIRTFVETWRPVLIVLNDYNHIESDLISFRVALNPVKFRADIEFHKSNANTLVIPKELSSGNVFKGINKTVKFFGCEVMEGCFEFKNKGAVIPNSLVFSYALAICQSGEAASISLIGFDGYDGDDPRNAEVEKSIELFKKNSRYDRIFSLTKTKYKGVEPRSIYAGI